MEDIKLIKIFFSKPGDVVEEIEAFNEVLIDINKFFSHFVKFQLMLLTYGKSTFSQSGNSAQKIVNEEIGTDYDIYVGTMWKTIGSPTTTEKSGTIEEFHIAYRRFKENPNSVKISFYFRIAQIKNKEESNKYEKVLEFKDEISKQQEVVLYVDYYNLMEFKEELSNGLYKSAKLIMDYKYKPNEIYKISPEKEYEILIEDLNDYAEKIKNNNDILNIFANEFLSKLHEIESRTYQIEISPKNINLFEKILIELKSLIKDLSQKTELVYPTYRDLVFSYLTNLNKIIFILNKLQYENRTDLLMSFYKIISTVLESYEREIKLFEGLIVNYEKFQALNSSMEIIKEVSYDFLNKLIKDYKTNYEMSLKAKNNIEIILKGVEPRILLNLE